MPGDLTESSGETVTVANIRGHRKRVIAANLRYRLVQGETKPPEPPGKK